MRQIRWTRRALGHFDAIAAYIRDYNPAAAERVTARIRTRIATLGERPFLGRPGRIENTRELFIGRYQYTVVYRVTETTIIVLAVFHTAQDRYDELD